MKIQEYINGKNKYNIDSTYQRPNNVWSMADKQCLIDTILRGEPMPLFFLNYISSEEAYYIVDGQQRLNCIRDFYDNKIKLSSKFSDKELEGCTFNGANALPEKYKNLFLRYQLQCHIMENYDDEKVRLIFSRLQRGKPLNLGEKLNAMPGKIVNVMRSLAEHKFFTTSIGVVKQRYGIYPDVARIMYYSVYGVKDAGTEQIVQFFDTYKDLDFDSREYKKIVKCLNYLANCFPDENYYYLSKHAWVLAVYMFVDRLMLEYSVINEEQDIQSFIKAFHIKIYNEDLRRSNPDYQNFYDNIRSGWSEKNMLLRKNTLIKYFLKEHPLSEMDSKRQITDSEKLAVFSKCQVCNNCGKEFKDYKEPEYHHVTRHVDGGKTQVDNIIPLCSKCHKDLHANDYTLPKVDNNDYEEIE